VKKLRKKHIVTDRQRRAKIKDGMEQLRSLLSSHGSFTTDQVSIMMASVQLIQHLREESSFRLWGWIHPSLQCPL